MRVPQDHDADFLSASHSHRDGESSDNYTALFVGAHPDDIEIACGGTLAKLGDLGWQTWVCVLTDENDADLALTRRKETITSAAICGVDPHHILFLGVSDGALECNSSTVSSLRRLATDHRCSPDLIFTHTRADSHNDHRAAHDVVLSSFRKKAVLCFAVVNSLIESHFAPTIFIEIAAFEKVKLRALASHRTQQSRIDTASIQQFHTAYPNQGDGLFVEPFEIFVQYGADVSKRLANSLGNKKRTA